MKRILGIFLFMTVAHATENDLHHRPKSFPITGGQAIFADFTEANYEITYDISKKLAFVKADISFETIESGLPIFDSVEVPTKTILDGNVVSQLVVKTPHQETTVRVLNKVTAPGRHKMQIEVPLTKLIEFKNNGVKSAFWTSDLDEREFLELYMPANFEFDQVKMTFILKFIGAKNKQNIYTNGVIKELNNQTYQISYPAYYTSSSIFFHTVPSGSVSELRFTLKSIDGRVLPVVVYSRAGSSLERLKQTTTEVFHELEADYGTFVHPSITVYQAGSGGMEYCGATMTDLSSLGHELFHSYFARGVMPANGNAGWLDEALASWRDNGYQTETTLSGTSMMSSHPYYTRITDTAAYSFGSRFMSYLDGKTQSKGGLKPFLRHMVEKKVFAPLFVEEFYKEMGMFYGISVEADFKKYTYGRSNFFSLDHNQASKVHRKMSVKELKKYL
jgi:hypothetical protein